MLGVGGADADDVVSCVGIDGERSFAEYGLDGHAMTFDFAVGHNTDAGRGTGTVRVLADGQELYSHPVGTGTEQVTLDVTDVRVLRIEVSGTSEDENNPAEIALAEARFQGEAEGIAQLGSSR